MSDAEYAVFERPAARRAGTGASGRLGRPNLLGLDGRRLTPENDDGPLATAEKVRTVTDPAAARAAREAGGSVFRIPKMPLRLIPQISAHHVNTPGAPWGVTAVGADQPHQYTGAGVCVAVLDTGIDATHPSFEGLITANNYVDFTGTGLEDNVGHGTHCAGIIFGRSVGRIRIGVAPGISNILIGKIADTNFEANTLLLQRAMMWAVNEGAHIISLSIGLDFVCHSRRFQKSGLPADVALAAALNDYRDYTRFFDRLMGMVVTAGAAANSALVIAACGNDSRAEKDGVRVPATLPAVAENVIAVGALDRDPAGNLSVSSYSNTSVNICGPGSAILSARPTRGAGANGKTSTATMSGTSQAAPHVAGVAALWWQKLARQKGFDRVTPTNVRDVMIGAARSDKVNKQDDPDAVGAGLVMAPTI